MQKSRCCAGFRRFCARSSCKITTGRWRVAKKACSSSWSAGVRQQVRLRRASWAKMKLAVPPPVLPMLAKRVSALPEGGGWLFEPKWDGFRTLIFRDGEEVLLQSRDQKPLNRYFPELIEPLLAGLP